MPDVSSEEPKEPPQEAPGKEVIGPKPEKEKRVAPATKVVTAEEYQEAAPEREQLEDEKIQNLMDEFLENHGQRITELVMNHEEIDGSKVRGICVRVTFGLAPDYSREKDRFVYLAPGEDEETLTKDKQEQKNVIGISDNIGGRNIKITAFLQKN